jgi:hypothetical protein
MWQTTPFLLGHHILIFTFKQTVIGPGYKRSWEAHTHLYSLQTQHRISILNDIIINMIIDEFITQKEEILNTHNWREKHYTYLYIGGQKTDIKFSIERCEDCGEYKSYNKTNLEPCAGKLSFSYASKSLYY